MQRKKLVAEEKALFNVVKVYRERGNYLQRLDLFEKAIESYNEALRWNSTDVRALLGRAVARAKATHYAAALADASKAAELEPHNGFAQQILAQTEYERCNFERALVRAHRGQRKSRFPPEMHECVRHAEETVRECTDKSASKVLTGAIPLLQRAELRRQSADEDAPIAPMRQSRMKLEPTGQVQEISRMEKHKEEIVYRLMSSKYLERMAHDKYFLTALSKDVRLSSANVKGSQQLQELAEKALADVEKRQEVLRERRPFYAARASEAEARQRLSRRRKELLLTTQHQNIADAKRVITAAEQTLEQRDTAKCLENAEFALEQISRKPASLLPGKEKFLQLLYEIFGQAFLGEKHIRKEMNERDRERRAFVMLGLVVSREPSRDSVLRVRPPAPPRDVKLRLRTLERALELSARTCERCYLLHELSRLHCDTKHVQKAKFYAIKCQAEARASKERVWLLNAHFLRSKIHILQNNRPEARATLLEAAALARVYGYPDVAVFFDTCASVSTEGEVESAEGALEQREKEVVSLMQDDDLKAAAKHLFRRMSTMPANRRFSIMPGTVAVAEETSAPAAGRRVSIMPKVQQPAFHHTKSTNPLGLQDFDY